LTRVSLQISFVLVLFFLALLSILIILIYFNLLQLLK
jgi:hypothetical protein